MAALSNTPSLVDSRAHVRSSSSAQHVLTCVYVENATALFMHDSNVSLVTTITVPFLLQEAANLICPGIHALDSNVEEKLAGTSLERRT